MKKFILFFLISITISNTGIYSQNNLPYPVIFVHGLAGSDKSFATTMKFLSNTYNLGSINVFDIVLNADDNTGSSKMWEDVKWNDFWYSGDYINVGRRNYDDDKDNFVDGWTGSNIFAINFQEERIRGAWGFWNDYFDQSNEAGIFKQGYALGKMIQEVLNYTGAEKVILVGHSMGGLCIREYLQRTNSSGIHTNWVDPSSADGHKVARVATYGTPHLGSNTSPDPTKSLSDKKDNKSTVPNVWGNSEANRDLLWEYDSYTNCGGTPKGIYMFGGNEDCISGVWYNSTFDNVDINCDGDEYDNIIGINESYYSYDYNPAMPLPLNIKYTYLTSIWTDWGGNLIGDGAVNINRQWLHSGNTPSPAGLTDTTLNDIFHTSEGSDYYNIIRGIDEPHRFDLAYTLNYNKPIIGFITYQQNLATSDIDVFKINASGKHVIAISINGSLSGVHTIGFYDASENMLCSRPVSSFPAKLYLNVPDGAVDIYIKISGTANNSTWLNPYTLTVIEGSWTGNISAYWNLSSNWTKGVADIYDDVYIPSSSPNMPVISSDVNCNRMAVPVNSKLTINPTASLNIHNNLNLYGDIILMADYTNTASYLDNGIISGNGKVTLDRNLQSGGYHYLSAHVSDGNSNVFTQLNNGQQNTNLYLYDETNSNPNWLYGWTQASGIMQPAKGYAYYAPYEQINFKLSGKPNTGNYLINVTNSGNGISSDGWNLIGNPYPSSISAVDFINLNNSGIINGSIYLWDDDYSQYYVSEDYVTFNLSGYVSGTGGGKIFNDYIAPGQAFFVKANNNGNVLFSNGIRRINNSTFFKKTYNSDIKRIYVNLGNENVNNNIMLAITDEATEGFDLFYDAEKIKIHPDFSFYSICENKDLIIQAIPEIIDYNEIRLGIETENKGIYTFRFDSVENLPSNMHIYLKDSDIKSFIDISEQTEYKTYIDAGINKERFSIVFTPNEITNINIISDNNVNIFLNGNKIYISGIENNTCDFYLFDISGKSILQKKITGNISTLETSSLAKGFYIIKIVYGEKIITKKVMLQ